MFVSIRYKFLGILFTLLFAAIVSFLYLATDLFNSDKKAYIYDNNAALTEALAKEAETGIQSTIKSLRFVGITFTQRSKDQSSVLQATKDLFQSETDLVDLSVYEIDPSSGNAKRLLHLVEKRHLKPLGLTEKELIDLEQRFPYNRTRIQENRLSIESVPAAEGFELTKVSIPFESNRRNLIITAQVLQGQRFKMFQRSKVYTTFLVNRYGQLLAHSDRKELNAKDPFSGNQTVRDILDSPIVAGATEYENQNGEELILAFRKVDKLGLTVFSQLPSDKAFAASQIFIEKSVLFAMLILSISFVLSIPFTRKLTAAIRQLYAGTMKVSKGNFDIDIPVKSNDEIGSLSRSFNKMTGEITRLIKETVDKARMEKEIELAHHVQDNFIPEDYLEVGNVEVASYFKTASECGGDWWGYQINGSKLLVMLGDATGHGVGPALITAAVHSCNATLSWLKSNGILNELRPSQIMSAFNRSVFMAGKGEIKMTFFIAQIDVSSGEVVYCNASHEMPITCPPEPTSGDKFKLSDLEPLVGTPGPCLGEKEESTYNEYRSVLADNHKLLIYTDGITECTNASQDEYGDTRFFRSLFKVAHLTAREIKEDAINRMNTFLDGQQAEDDVTLIVVNRKSHAVVQKNVG